MSVSVQLCWISRAYTLYFSGFFVSGSVTSWAMRHRRAGWFNAGSEAGYTLIELLVVLAILAFLTSMAFALSPPLRLHNGSRLMTMQRADQLAERLRNARRMAMDSGAAVEFKLPGEASPVWFYPDGSASAAVITVLPQRIIISPLTGQISVD